MSYIDRLISNCEEAKKAKSINEFIFDNTGEFDKFFSELKHIDTAIYIIEQIGGDPQKTFEKLLSYKKTRERSCPAMNAPSKIMYVGSSTTGVGKRLKQHIGEGHKGTYALHLSHWFDGKYVITVKQYNIAREVLQIIEDNISDKLSPAFGKQGGNNK